MLILLALATAAAILPVPEYNTAVYVQRELQRIPQFERETAAVAAQLWIGPTGQVLDCEIVRWGGNEAVAEQVCKLLKHRKLKPARDSAGDPIHAMTGATVAWAATRERTDQLAQAFAKTLPADQTIAAGSTAADRIGLLLTVDADGRVESCQASDRKTPELGSQFCPLVQEGRFAIRKNSQDEPVRYLRLYSIAPDKAGSP